jgi:hypothetical protein
LNVSYPQPRRATWKTSEIAGRTGAWNSRSSTGRRAASVTASNSRRRWRSSSRRSSRVAEEERDRISRQRDRRNRPRRCRSAVPGRVGEQVSDDVRPARARLRGRPGSAAAGLRAGSEPRNHPAIYTQEPLSTNRDEANRSAKIGQARSSGRVYRNELSRPGCRTCRSSRIPRQAGAGQSVRCTGSPFWGPILYSGTALAAASTPSVRIVGRRARAEAPRGPGEARHGSRQTRLPVEAIEKTLDVLVVERQRLHEQRSGPEPLEANRRAIVYWQRELAEARRPTSASA